ncbi:MAG: carbamate kinase [Methanobacteriota archaeon]
MKKRAVIALGGNALIKKGQKGTIYEQFANTRESCVSIVEMIKAGWDVVITHGNGPQVGAIFLQNEAAKAITPAMPLGICVAESEGLIGYMIQQCLSNALKKENIERPVVALITQVIVDRNDTSLTNPSKPIGPYYSEDDAVRMLKEGYVMTRLPRGWRMLAPSPDPKRIVEGDVIMKLLDDGVIVISSGGGGMPVIEKEGWGLDGLEAVVDKDLAAERIAEAITADVLLILTDVEHVYLHYNTPQQQAIHTISLQEIKKHYQDGQFPTGSMGPKILAAIRFLEFGGKKVVISNIQKGWAALNGETGTSIVKK